MVMRIYSFKIPDATINLLDKIVEKEGYLSRSHAVREILMDYIRERLLKGLEGVTISIGDYVEAGIKRQPMRVVTLHLPECLANLIEEAVRRKIFPDKASLIRRAIRVYFDVEGFPLLAECNGGEEDE